MIGDKDRNTCQPTVITQRLGQDFGLVQDVKGSSPFSQSLERPPQVQPDVDGLGARVALLWQMLESVKRLLEISHCLAVARMRHGLLPCLLKIRQRLVPHLPTQGMVR